MLLAPRAQVYHRRGSVLQVAVLRQGPVAGEARARKPTSPCRRIYCLNHYYAMSS